MSERKTIVQEKVIFNFLALSSSKAEESKSIAHLLPRHEEQEEVIHIIIMANIRPSNQAEQTAKSETPPGSYTHSYEPKISKRLILHTHQLYSSSHNNKREIKKLKWIWKLKKKKPRPK